MFWWKNYFKSGILCCVGIFQLWRWNEDIFRHGEPEKVCYSRASSERIMSNQLISPCMDDSYFYSLWQPHSLALAWTSFWTGRREGGSEGRKFLSFQSIHCNVFHQVEFIPNTFGLSVAVMTYLRVVSALVKAIPESGIYCLSFSHLWPAELVLLNRPHSELTFSLGCSTQQYVTRFKKQMSWGWQS